MSKKCRVWWPKELESAKPSQSSKSQLLFGWFISCSAACLDVVVAFAYDEAFLSHHSDSKIEEAVHHANVGMPTTLQDKYRFTVLGRVLTCENTDSMCKFDMVDCDPIKPSKSESLSQNSESSYLTNCRKWRSSLHCSSWIQLEHNPHSSPANEGCRVPTLHHLHWNGKVCSQAELHVIVYETPRFGHHHFSVNTCNANYSNRPLRKPKWVERLYQKPQCIDLDTVILAVNCSTAANTCFDRDLTIQKSRHLLSVLNRPFNFIWRLWAAVVASISTFFYIILQLLHKLAMYGSKVWSCIALTDIFSSTWKNVQVRCFQILYWPIFLSETGIRSQACVQYAEKAALRRHSLWSSIAVDALLGNLVGYTLLLHSETFCKWISTFSDHFTNDVLRTGCVWLMGVPAGFKLNMELAGFLGIISLNAVQIWSTLSVSASYFCNYVVKAVALSGMLLGITIPAALITDRKSVV